MRSLGGGIAWVFSTQLLLQLVPTHVRGRVFSFEQATFALTSALAAAVSGILLDAFPNVPYLLLGMAALAIIPGILWAIWCYNRPIDENFSAE